MRGRTEWRAALAMLAGMAGGGLASGRELSLFFAQLGEAAWAGILTASALFGLLTGCAVWRGPSPAICAAPLERLCETLRLLLAAVVAVFMLYSLGEVGALTLPLPHGWAFGAAFGLLAALCLTRLKAHWLPGLVVLLYVGGFCAANAVDPRPTRLHIHGCTEFVLAGNIPAALLLAALYAALTACAGNWSLSRLHPGAVRPAALGLRAAVLLCFLLCLANLALLRGGNAVIAHPMPWVALSARWGLAGFWLCAGLKAACAVTTLSAALSTFLPGVKHHRIRAVVMLVVGVITFVLMMYFSKI